MRAASITATGPAENIQIGQLPDPVPVGAQVLVRVAAAAVNPIDTYLRSGSVPMELPMPYIVGCDLAGTVEALGPDADLFQVGDRVWGSNQGLLGRQGTFAQLAAVDQQWLYPTPATVSDEMAAAAALPAITAHLGLVREAQLRAGETVVVSGGGGAVGQMVIQMAKALGATVIATTSTEQKEAACRALGADQVVNYLAGNFQSRILEAAAGGVNLWWETARAPQLETIVDCLAEEGRIVLMAGRDARPELPVGPFYVKCCRMFGFVMFKAPAAAQRTAAEKINAWLVSGALRPLIAHTAALEETAALHRLQEQNTVQGKGVVTGKLLVRP